MNPGRIEIRFEGGNRSLIEAVPVHVLDARFNVVSASPGDQTHQLDPGLYLIRGTAPNGQPFEQLITVTPGSISTVVVPSSGSVDDTTGSFADVDALLDTSLGDSASTPAHLVQSEHCDAVKRDEYWVFERTGGVPDQVPRATFRIGPQTVRVSLPLGDAGARSCVVGATVRNGRDRIEVRFGRQRRDASTIESIIRSGNLEAAAGLSDLAGSLLRQKGADPTAAALGGLTLNRLGQLDERAVWVENLSNWFDWLPDGQILQASLQGRDPSKTVRDQGLDLLLETAARRAMFTDGHSLLLDLLRRWPDGRGAPARSRALEAVDPDAAHVDWEAVCLSDYIDASAP